MYIQNIKIFTYLPFFLLFFSSSCITGKTEEIEWNITEYDGNIVIESSQHLAFPDLTYYGGNWYVTYRESDAHVLGTYSKIKVLQSANFKNWTECNSFEIPGYDLRDPKFSYNEVTDSLYLHFHVVNEKGTLSANYGSFRKNYYVPFDKNSFKFNDQRFYELKQPQNLSNFWLWRPYWYQQNLYVGGYNNSRLVYLKYSCITTEPVIFSELKGQSIGETTLKIFNNRLYSISRRKNDTLFGELTIPIDSLGKVIIPSKIPIDTISIPIGQLSGPNMVILDSIVYLGGRSKDDTNTDRTIIYQYSLRDKNLKKIETLISYGDNSYPGFFLLGNTIYGIYYTQNRSYNKYQIRSFSLNVDNY
ncbi:MAG: hypothetical protein PWQ06_1248 [Anaerophaga sp.]|nr:hypothetical protein [Anaerophaga sp.]